MMRNAEPKPRIRCTEPPQYQCGWCGKWSVAEDLRFGGRWPLGNDWPIHRDCFADWYGGESRPVAQEEP